MLWYTTSMSAEYINQYGTDPFMKAKVAALKKVGWEPKVISEESEAQRRAPQALWESIEEYLGRFRTTTEGAVDMVWETAEKRGIDLYRANGTGQVDEGQVYQNFPYTRTIVELVRKSPYADFDMLALPEDYKQAVFDDFEILCDGHKIALRLLQRFGINPPKGLYFWGNYGTGKTHLVAAYALSINQLLELEYLGSVCKFTDDIITEKINKYRERDKANETLRNRATPETQKKLQAEYDQLVVSTDRYVEVYTQEQFDRIVGDSPHKPSDLAFITFDDLFDRRDDENFVEDLLSRRIVIIDDIHPKGERERMNLIQRIIERRYNEARTGATFITSNIKPEQLLSAKSYPRQIGERVHSRLQEMCMPIQFETKDYRIIKAGRQNAEILKMLEETE